MQNVVERIARHADIDTRRAMGFLPRKLVIPDLNLPFEFDHSAQLCTTIILRGDVALYVYHSCFTTGWRFDTRYYGLYRNGKVGICIDYEWEISRHPDFNEDGTLRAWRA